MPSLLYTPYKKTQKRCLQHSRSAAAPVQPGEPPTISERLAWTVHHSFTSISATSFTTAAAFAANLTSSITPVRLFGLFMVILVLVNYVFVLTLLLALLVLRERNSGLEGGGLKGMLVRIAGKRGACWVARGGRHPSGVAAETELVPLSLPGTVDADGEYAVNERTPFVSFTGEAHHTVTEGSGAPTAARYSGCASLEGVPVDSEDILVSVTQRLEAHARRAGGRRRGAGACGCLGDDGTRMYAHEWLEGPYAHALCVTRWLIVAVATVAVAFLGWRASLLTLPNSQPSVWRAQSNIHKYFDLVRPLLEPCCGMCIVVLVQHAHVCMCLCYMHVYTCACATCSHLEDVLSIQTRKQATPCQTYK
jgi:hypothetical protein